MIDHLGDSATGVSAGDGFAVSAEGSALSFDAGGFSLTDSQPSDDAFSPQLPVPGAGDKRGEGLWGHGRAW